MRQTSDQGHGLDTSHQDTEEAGVRQLLDGKTDNFESRIFLAQRSYKVPVQPKTASTQRPSLANTRPATSNSGFEAPGTPSRGEAENGNSMPEQPAASSTTIPGRFPINSQTLAGIVFFLALGHYGDKDTAMALALCLESTLYWDYFASSNPNQKANSGLVASALLARRSIRQSQRHPRSHNMKSRFEEPMSERRKGDSARYEDPKRESKPALKRRSDFGSPSGGKKRSRSQSVFSTTSLHAGMAVLLRTQPEEVDGWDKSWSLGKVLRIISARHTIDVVWLKPVPRVNLLSDKIFTQRWVPWTFPGADKGEQIEWKSKGISMSSVQYGVWFPKTGFFPPEVQELLSTEVTQLEQLIKEEQAQGRFQALRKNSSPYRLPKGPKLERQRI